MKETPFEPLFYYPYVINLEDCRRYKNIYKRERNVLWYTFWSHLFQDVLFLYS